MLVKPEVAAQQLGEQPGTEGGELPELDSNLQGNPPPDPNFSTELARASGGTVAQAFFRQRAA